MNHLSGTRPQRPLPGYLPTWVLFFWDTRLCPSAFRTKRHSRPLNTCLRALPLASRPPTLGPPSEHPSPSQTHASARLWPSRGSPPPSTAPRPLAAPTSSLAPSAHGWGCHSSVKKDLAHNQGCGRGCPAACLPGSLLSRLRAAVLADSALSPHGHTEGTHTSLARPFCCALGRAPDSTHFCVPCAKQAPVAPQSPSLQPNRRKVLDSTLWEGCSRKQRAGFAASAPRLVGATYLVPRG